MTLEESVMSEHRRDWMHGSSLGRRGAYFGSGTRILCLEITTELFGGLGDRIADEERCLLGLRGGIESKPLHEEVQGHSGTHLTQADKPNCFGTQLSLLVHGSQYFSTTHCQLRMGEDNQ
jgi:hypothetical protein